MLLSITSIGGVNYAFMAADKVARAWIEAETITAEDFERKVVARFADTAPAGEPVKKRREQATGTLFD